MCNAFTDSNLTGGMRTIDHLVSTRCFSYINVPYDKKLCKHFAPTRMFWYLAFSCLY